ncbi:AAA family ATPase [Melissococcus plutonius]
MKITAIEIVGFGKWQQKKINFTENNQLVNGKNEAGKSTIYQFIQTILFGFPARGKKRENFCPKMVVLMVVDYGLNILLMELSRLNVLKTKIKDKQKFIIMDR